MRLTEKETAILKYLYRAGDKVVGRDVLLGEVWGYNAGVTTHTLETHVYRLRQKIEADPSNAQILVTEPGGYRLVPIEAAVPAVGRGAAASSTSAASASSIPPSQHRPAPQTRSRDHPAPAGSGQSGRRDCGRSSGRRAGGAGSADGNAGMANR